MKTPTMLIVVLMTCASFQASAQSDTPQKTGAAIGPQVGFYKAQDADAAKAMGGIALRIKLSDAIGVEGSINYKNEEYSNGYVNVKSWPMMLTGLIYPLPIVYGAIGAGWYNTAIEYNVPSTILTPAVTLTSETQQQFGWHFGGGVELPIGSVMKLVGDIRYVYLDYNFKNFPGSDGVRSNFYVMTAGLLFNL